MTVLSALNGYYDRLAKKDAVPPYGYSYENISYVVELTPTGKAVNVIPLIDTTGKKPRPQRILVPQPVRRTSGVAPNFLWDKTSYVLGVTESANDRTAQEHEAFKALHDHALANSDDEGLRALLKFLVDWTPDKFGQPPFDEGMRDSNVVFKLDGERGFLYDRIAAKSIWERLLSTELGEEGLCLVTGETAPVARLHPAIKGVLGAQMAGASIVSFNLDAFASYGKEQGANSPVSEYAAFGYTTALNKLLERGSSNRVQIADATTLFWAEASDDGEAAAEAAEQVVAGLFAPPRPSDDSQEAAKVRDTLQMIAKGRPLKEISPNLEDDTRMYVLGLSPNAARLSVRFWYVGNLRELADRFREHWDDLFIEPSPWRVAPSIWRLVAELLPTSERQRKSISDLMQDKRLAKEAGELMRAILTGAHYPRSLLAGVVMRLRADRNINGMRAAICKACVNRHIRKSQKLKNKNIEDTDEGRMLPMALNEESKDIAYNLGRLFAAYAYAERSYIDRGASIRDKYSGAASATPRRVFPILMRGYEHNRSALAKSGDENKRRYGIKADKVVSAILEQYDGDVPFPTSLRLEDQARFFVGFYHQDSAFYAKRPKPDADDEREE